MSDFLNKNPRIILGGLITVGVITGLITWAKKRRWVLVGHVQNLYIFPLKSGAALETDRLEFESMGPKLDRMIDRGFAVALQGSFTIKDTHSYPRLCLVKLTMEEADAAVNVILSSEDVEDNLVFSLPSNFETEPEERFVSTSIIGGECRSVWDCGDMAAAWISNTLAGKDKGLRLVYHYSDNSQRTHSPKYLAPFGSTMAEHHLPALSNASPYHLVTQASVDDLNKRIPNLTEPITALNFRPNILVKTLDSTPYQEDRWKLVNIGGAILEFSLPDNRCITVNYNQVTSKKNDAILKWLKNNR